ncbi:MAG: 16S rRNA (adenine(1518)-N(6)/adenine(1519)-N(6))-dimethyltransferase RsmA [Clostridia bacterium]|nr:16S rRNA (adenine(1518)-N(6)/adenine(1519)-N(6))-dimethyltransferase RsmA [Clostridia bacterium]
MKQGFRHKKEMGQHFLSDPVLIERLADASLVSKADGVLEIGPGPGLLTAALARRARRVIAVELDKRLLQGLRTTLALYPNVEIRQGDILRADLDEIVRTLGFPSRVAANLPYNITTPLLQKLLPLSFSSVAVMVQREVGLRLAARPGEDGYGPLSLLAQFYADVIEAVPVQAACFTPPPKVDSSFMLLTKRDKLPVNVTSERSFFRLVAVSFTMRRKTLANNLMAGYGLARETAEGLIEAAGLPETARAEKVDMEGFARILESMGG